MQPLAKLLTITITIGKYCLPALAIVMILGGCGGPRWDQLDQIQMVRPLPEPLPGDMEHTALGAGYIGSPGGEGSFFGSDLRIAAAITDNRDSVLGKSCLSVTMAHRILYVQTNYRYVIEADIGKASGVGTVPEALTLVALASQSVAGKPTGRSIMGLGDTGIVMSSARGEISQCVSMMEEAIFETRGDPDSSRISQMRNKRFAGASIRLSKALNQSMEIMLTGKRIEERLGNLPAKFGGTMSRSLKPKTIPEAMVFNHILLNTLARPSRAVNRETSDQVHAMYLQYAHERVLEIIADSDTYRGAHSNGFENSWTAMDGVSVRISRSGQVIRLEISGGVIRDPLMTDSDMSQTGQSVL
ncbi:MAG: hypothetical protein HN350_15535 [Phycisphaerales bacterium]|jgi:hypothetical protein|nr:hypothetical protein [Phycisphaerales bacterium]